jgi:antitoxin (DNA-binding transcriptional repressor) of toxin-antitoxin stability system
MNALYSTRDARNQFNKIINGVFESGEEILITRDNKPIVKITAINNKARKLGLLATKSYKMDSRFDDESNEVNDMFYGDHT